MTTDEAFGKGKPQPNLEKINHVMKRFEEVFNTVVPNQTEMALIGLTVLQCMLDHCEANKQACPSSMGIQTPNGYEITYTIRKRSKFEPNLNPSHLLPGLGGGKFNGKKN